MVNRKDSQKGCTGDASEAQFPSNKDKKIYADNGPFKQDLDKRCGTREEAIKTKLKRAREGRSLQG